MIAIDRITPQWAKQDWSNGQLPALQQASDILWGLGKQTASPDKLNFVRQFVIVSIVNRETQGLIARAIATKRDEPHYKEYAPGSFIGMNEDAGKALLGMQNRGHGPKHSKRLT